VSPIVVAQISDLHVVRAGERLYGRIDTGERLRRCVDAIARLPVTPDALVASGDLVNEGTAEEYALLRALLAPLSVPLFPLAGNHDERAALRAAFPEHRDLLAGERLYYAIEVGGLRLIMLDTVVTGEDRGALDAAQLAWLERELARHEGPALIFMHHPPCPTGIPYMDAIRLDPADASKLAVIVARFPQVQRISCGHVHRAIVTRWGGTAVGVCPSSAFQYRADPRIDAVPVVTDEQPAYQLHLWDGAALVTHTLQITAAE